MTRLVFASACVLAIVFGQDRTLAVGQGPGGIDVHHVPISWCAVQGSPAATSPNITQIGSTQADTNTDAVLWRRHERPTDNIYLPQASISFRSAINNAWGTLNFPIIADPDTTQGAPGDIRGDDVNAFGQEYNDALAACETAWTNLGRSGIGVTAINVNLFNDGTGNYIDAAQQNATTAIGWGGCDESVATGNCVVPYEGRIAVIDNQYLYPTVADRTWPPSPNDPTGAFQYSVSDPFDQLVGHELGHALSLNHRSDQTTALMFPQQQDNDGDGQTDNITLATAEVTQARTNAPNVPGVETDPPQSFVPGDFVRTRIPDSLRDAQTDRRYLDLSALKATLNKKNRIVEFGAQLGGVIPGAGRLEAWFFIDTDGRQSGLDPGRIGQLGGPATEFRGADLLVVARVADQRVTGEAWRVERGELIPIRTGLVFDLTRLVMHPHFAAFKGTPPKIGPAQIHDTVIVRLPAAVAGVTLNRFFTSQVVLREPGQAAIDRLDDSREELGRPVILEDPSFPHCFVADEARPGSTVKIRIEGLRPNQGIHGLLGPVEVFKGMTDGSGGGVINFPIPPTTKPGPHLVTIGTDGTALTADCTVLVTDRKPEEDKRPFDARVYSLVKSHEQLLHSQQRLLETLGGVIREVITTRRIDDADAASLAKEYNELVRQQTGLIQRFEKLVDRAAQ
jgi:hypothetical protein